MIKVLSIFGTRAEAIKMVPLIKELESRSVIESTILLTGQHKEMLDQVLKSFNINADYNLNIMKDKQTLTDITTSVLIGTDKIIKEVKPDIILVHGDTTSAFAGALSAFYNHIKIGHIEAGLRTYDKYSPYPEEMNRQFIDCLADYCFVPTNLSRDNLLKENKQKDKIYITGNTVIDALNLTINKNYKNNILDSITKDKRIILFTMHRRENIGIPMINVFKALIRLIKNFSDIVIVFPIHPNPEIRSIAEEYLSSNDRIKIIEPLDVIDFHNFQNKSYMILTDSGGIQEEAPSLGKPVLVLRNTTERQEGVSAGTLKLIGTEEETVYKETSKLLINKELYNKMSSAKNPYGDGLASKRIVDTIIKDLKKV